ncbi:hypothetical protein FRC06_011597 [Ceratobasidium sp. 370]|nr:hypothetical protein FRC06_011597 [Ceratobasidium sp. 370]
MSIDFDDKPPEWPLNIIEFGSENGAKRLLRESGSWADIWLYQPGEKQLDTITTATSVAAGASTIYVIKVPKQVDFYGSQPNSYLHLLRKIVRERYSLQHRNIVEMIGIHTGFQPYPGLVFEHCEQYSLDQYKLRSPQYFDLHTRHIIDILGGLRYLHGFPTPIAHGNLNPASSASFDAAGTLKLTLFSLSHLVGNISNTDKSETMKEQVGNTRYLSPEMLQTQARSSMAADMWAFGCIVFWLYTGLSPYHEISDEAEVEAKILRGSLPYNARLLVHQDEFFKQLTRQTWLTNGISDWAEKCWKGTGRPTASEVLKFALELPTDMAEKDLTWERLGLTNLSGSVTSTAEPIVTIKFSSHKEGSAAFMAVQASMGHELRILAQLKHANVCSLWGYEDSLFGKPRAPAIVTEFCSNGTLKEYLSGRTASLSRQEKIKLVDHILKGVQYLHDGVAEGSIAHGNLNTVRELPLAPPTSMAFPRSEISSLRINICVATNLE